MRFSIERLLQQARVGQNVLSGALIRSGSASEARINITLTVPHIFGRGKQHRTKDLEDEVWPVSAGVVYDFEDRHTLPNASAAGRLASGQTKFGPSDDTRTYRHAE